MTPLIFVYLAHQSIQKDVHILGTTLDKAVVQLGRIFGSPMDCSNLIKDKVILIDAFGVTESEIRDQVAKTVNATWEKKETGWHLTKTANQQRGDLAYLESIRLRMLKKTIDLRASTDGSKAAFTKAFATQTFQQLRNEEKNGSNNHMDPPGPTAAGYGLPNQRFMSAFLQKFGMNRIAAIPNGHRAVFALNPNAMQMPLGVDIRKEIDQFNTEQSTWERMEQELSKDQEGAAKTTDILQGGLPRGFYSGREQSFTSSYTRMPTNPSNVLFTVFCTSDGSYSMKLIGVPSVANEPAFTVAASSFEGIFAGMTQQDFEPKIDPAFKLSQAASDFEAFFTRDMSQIPEARRAADLNEFADPTHHDPLSYGLSEAFIYDARKSKHNLVALLEDSNLNIFQPLFGDMWLNERFAWLFADFVFHDDKWIRIGNIPGGEPNFPRADLRNIIRRVRANGRVNLEDRAAIASLRPRTNAVSYIEGMLAKFVSTPTEDGGEDDALKCIGMLNESERAQAFSPNGMRFSQLNTRLQRHLFECSYYNEQNRLSAIGQKNLRIEQWVRDEPTLLAPNGILGEAVFKITENRQDQIKAADSQNSIGLLTDAKGWGSTKYQMEHPEFYKGSNFTFDLKTRLSRVTVTSYTFSLIVTPEYQWTSNLQTVVPVSGAPFTIDQIPEDMKADFEAGYKESAEFNKKQQERKNKNGGGGGQQNESHYRYLYK